MYPRQTIIEIFSTFVEFSNDRFSGWAIDARLHRNIKNCLNKACLNNSNNRDEQDLWAVYWHKQTQTDNQRLAYGHMSAYLQEVCYWTVNKLIPRLQESQEKLPDLFQIAIESVPKILKSCNPDVSGSLKAYATTTFGNVIRNHLRQNREINLCTNWGLLVRISRKILTESLQYAGLDTLTIERYVLAWSCFESIYLPRKSPQLRQLKAPNPETWEAVTVYYNSRRHQLSASTSESTKETIERWVAECGAKVRKYLYPTVRSLNSPKPGYEEGELQDDLVDTLQQSLLTELINQEEQAIRLDQKNQINTILTEAITKLDANTQQLLELYYQKGLTQQQIASLLAVQQYTISRKLSKTRESLLLTLTRWSQQTLHISVTSDVVKYISTILEEWLQTHYV